LNLSDIIRYEKLESEGTKLGYCTVIIMILSLIGDIVALLCHGRVTVFFHSTRKFLPLLASPSRRSYSREAVTIPPENTGLLLSPSHTDAQEFFIILFIKFPNISSCCFIISRTILFDRSFIYFHFSANFWNWSPFFYKNHITWILFYLYWWFMKYSTSF